MPLIAVYADWDGLDAPLRLGRLHARRGAGREVFEFEFDDQALEHPATANLQLDPRGSGAPLPIRFASPRVNRSAWPRHSNWLIEVTWVERLCHRVHGEGKRNPPVPGPPRPGIPG